MRKPPPTARAGEPFGEREFYLEEFRGKSVLIALAPAVVAARIPLKSLGSAVHALVRNDTRVLLWCPESDRAVERWLLAAVGRKKPARMAAGSARRGRKQARRRPRLSPVLRLRAAALTSPQGLLELRSALWTRFRRGNLCIVSVAGAAAFPDPALDLAASLRVPKAVLVDPRGGLLADGGRLSFVDENQLETLLRQGQAEWSGLGDRRGLLTAVRQALAAGVEQVNLCGPEGVAEELFTYVGSGTLFTEGDYTRIGPLGIDEFAQAERLLERGERDGVLKVRSPAETAAVLASAYGATVCGRHLAGIAGLLTEPYREENAGEIVGLYTITRFKGEGLGERLVDRLLAEAERRGLAYVFAVTIDERARQFFERLGFGRVDPEALPAAKWKGYDPARRESVVAFRRWVTGPALSDDAD